FAQYQAKGPGERGFKRRHAHLAVALDAVSVPGGKQGSRRPYREIEGCAGDQLFQIHVAAEFARHDRGHRAVDLWRRHSHYSEERREFDLRAPRHGRDAALAVDPRVPDPPDWKILGQGPGKRPYTGVSPILPRVDREDLDFKHITGNRALDGDRAGQ